MLGLEAEREIAGSMELTGVLMRAGTNDTVKHMQILIAKEKYLDEANGTKMTQYKMKILVVTDDEGEQSAVKVDLKRKDFKNKWITKKSEIAA